MPGERLMPDGTTGIEGEGLVETDRLRAENALLKRVLGSVRGEEGDEGDGRRRTRDGKEVPKDYHIERYTSPQGIPIDVIWPDSQEEAEKHIRNLLGTIEIRKSDATQLTVLEHQNASSVLEMLETRNDPKKSIEENKQQQAWASRMRLEIKSRLVFHSAFNTYEGGKGGIKGVCDVAKELAPDFFNAIFEIEEQIKNIDRTVAGYFNPFVEALQYYEDYGHEFARANSEAGRPKFGKKAQEAIIKYVDKTRLGIDPNKSEKDFTPAEWDLYNKYVVGQLQEQVKTRFSEDINSQIGIDPTKIKDDFTVEEKQRYQKYEESGKLREFIKQKLDQAVPQNSNKSREKLNRELYLSNKLDEKEFAWAQNMAERLFRFTGRAMMYDYLVINKGSIDSSKPETEVSLDYEGSEKPTWASGRDGDDYPFSKFVCFRRYLKAEAGLMRSHIELMDGVDIYGGDFWTRTVDKCKGKYLTYGNSFWDREPAGKIFGEINGERVRVKIVDGNKVKLSDREKADQDEEIRMNDDNYGERVGRINFRLLRRTPKDKSTEAEGFDFRITEFEGEDLTKMGATPMGLWAVRCVEGPDEARKALSDDPSCFLLNPNFDSLGKLLNTFDYSKAESWETKKHLLRNFIKFARSEKIEGTGKEKYTEDEILAGVNKLTGLTDKNGVQFVQLPERIAILAEYFNIKVSERDRVKIEKKIRQKFPGADDSKITDEIDKEINKKLNSIIERKTDTRFVGSWLLGFLLGLGKGFLKEISGPLGGR